VVDATMGGDASRQISHDLEFMSMIGVYALICISVQ
jgi:hypothetical protein